MRTFSVPVQTGFVAHTPSYRMGAELLLGVKWLGHGVNYSSPSTTEIKERVKLYLSSPSGPSWQVTGCNFILLFVRYHNYNYKHNEMPPIRLKFTFYLK
jgi:hypothetical protein